MLLGLGHPPLVGRHHEQHRRRVAIERADTGEHVVHVARVSRNIDERQPTTVDLGEGETKLEGQPTSVLLGQTVGIGTGQRPHE